MAYRLTAEDRRLASQMGEQLFQRRSGTSMPQQQQPEERGNFFTNLLPTAGGILGGIGGSFLAPGLGTVAGGATGAGFGKFLENLIEGRTGGELGEGIAGEAALGTLGGIGKGFQAIKGASGALRAGEGVGKAGNILRMGAQTAPKSPGMFSRAGGRIKEGLQDRATTSLLKLTPSQTQKMLDAGIDPTDLAKRAAKYGGSPADIIGKTGKGGPLQQTIRSLEEGIKTTASVGGKNVRIDASDIVKALEAEKKVEEVENEFKKSI